MKKIVLCYSMIFLFSLTILSQIPTNGLVGYWSFNGNTGDESGNGNHGIPTDIAYSTDRFDNPAAAANFPTGNTTSQIEVVNINPTQFTVSIWLYKTNAKSYNTLISNFQVSNYQGFELQKGSKGSLGLILSDNSSWNSIIDTSEYLKETWHHIVAVYDGSYAKLFHDGDMVLNNKLRSGEYADSLEYNNFSAGSNPLIIGNRGGESFNFEGRLDDIRLYDRALSNTEISFLFNEGKCYETVYDTIPVYDSIAITDTLIIDAVLTGIDLPDNITSIKVYPNPAKDYIYIKTEDYSRMAGYQLKIIDQLGATVFETNVEKPLYEVNLSTLSGFGMYYLQVINSTGSIIDIRKIILQ